MKDYIVRATAAGSQVRAFAAVTETQLRLQDRPIIPALWPRPHWDGFSPQEP